MDRAAEERLRRLVVGEADFLARALRNLGVSDAELDDCVQKVFLTLARRLEVVELGKERAFLFGCAQNEAAHYRRSLARRREVPEDTVPEGASAALSPEGLVEQKRHRELLDAVLETLDEAARAVFVLAAFEQLTMAEIAVLLDVPPGTVASRLRRAREEFRKAVLAREAAGADTVRAPKEDA
jgi:RNA polymerase sigma-70 factor (ECF subfamily)